MNSNLETEPKFDKVGKWTEIKLEIIKQYAAAYNTILQKQPFLKPHYIDAFSGAGYHLTKDTGEKIKGSPITVLEEAPVFHKYHFIDLDITKSNWLEKECKKYPNANVEIYSGRDCNKVLHDLFPTIIYEKYMRALCLLDPYALHFSWEIVELAGQQETIELLLNFPAMDMQRSVLWSEPKRVSETNKEKMNKFWGDSSWQEIAYKENPQSNLFGEENKIKEPMPDVVNAYRQRLKDRAGFKYVSEPLCMRNSINATLYYLIFMSPNKTGKKIIQDIFRKYEE